MGHNTVVPSSSSFMIRDSYHKELFSGVHSAQVTDVNVDEGTINLSFDNLVFNIDGVTIPLLGLSSPPNSGSDIGINFKSSGWGRYIPQVGDTLLVAFSPEGHVHALGYSTPQYGEFTTADADNADSGGIGWGDTSGKTLKPGDWDFRAGRGSSMFLGDKATLASSNVALSLSQFSQDATLSAPLFLQNATQSKIRYGAARRQILPTDTQETYLSSVRTTYAQEFTVDMRWNNLTTDGAAIAYFAVGDVIDDDDVAGPKIRVSSNTFPVKYYFSATDDTGLIQSYEEAIDSYGNLEITSETAVSWKWTTPLAAWETSNLSTSITSTEKFEVSAGLEISLTAGAKCTISATGNLSLESQALIQLGGDSAISPVVKGTELLQAFTTFSGVITPLASTAGTAATPIPADIVKLAAAWAAMATQLPLLLSNISKALSTKAMVA